MIDLQEWAGTYEELLDTMDEAIGQFEVALAEDGVIFSDERDARRLFMEAFSRSDIQERILITALELQRRAEEAERARKELAVELTKTAAQLENARNNPKIPDGERFKIEKAARQQAEAAGQKKLEEAQKKAQREAEAAAKKAAEELEAARKQAADAEANRRAAEAAAENARRELEEARARIKMSSPDVAAFKTMFDALQGQIGKIRELLAKIGAEDPATAEKLGRALTAVAAQLTEI